MQVSFTANRVSVVIPCFRQAHFLEACLASLQAQSWPNWEAIVIDDGSPDDTQQVLARLAVAEPRLRSVAQPNRGLPAARNAGLAVATGEFVQFLDADDLIESDKFQWQVAVLNSRSDSSLVFGDALYFDDSDPSRRSYARNLDPAAQNWIQTEAVRDAPQLEKLLIRNQFPVCAPLVRRSSIDLAGPFEETLTSCEDWEYWIRMAATGHLFAYAPQDKTRALIRTHPSSMSFDRTRMYVSEVRMRSLTRAYMSDTALCRLAMAGAAKPLASLSPNAALEALDAYAGIDLRVGERFAIFLARIFVGSNLGRRLIPIARRVVPWRWSYLLFPLAPQNPQHMLTHFIWK